MEPNHPTYHELTLSNQGIIPDPLQQSAWETPVAVLGCGLGSAIVRQAVKQGFRRFHLTDPDTFEYTNLNRQWATIEHVGTPKVQAIKNQILRLNPHAQITTNPAGTRLKDIPVIIAQNDIIIDGMDPFSALEESLQLHHQAQLAGKLVIVPLELGHIGVIYLFGPSSTSYQDFIFNQADDGSGLWDFSKKEHLIAMNLLRNGPEYVKQLAHDALEGKRVKYPQLSGTTEVIAARVVRLMFQILDPNFLPESQPVKFAPNYYKVSW